MNWTPSSMGKKGGKRRAKNLSKERRLEISQKANAAKKAKKQARLDYPQAD